MSRAAQSHPMPAAKSNGMGDAQNGEHHLHDRLSSLRVADPVSSDSCPVCKSSRYLNSTLQINVRHASLASSRPSDRAVPTEYPAGPPERMIASRTTAARPSIPSSADRVPTLPWTGDPLCITEVVSRSAPRTRKPRRSAVCEALCRTRTGDPFLTMEVLYQLS